MKMRKGLISIISAVLPILLTAGLNFAQEEAALSEEEIESEVQWLWGEVVSVDTQKNEFVVKYLDYETDSDKETVVGVDDKTTYENVISLVEIAPEDTVSVDYSVGSDGKIMAKNISVEKAEATEASTEGTMQEEPEAAPTTEQ